MEKIVEVVSGSRLQEHKNLKYLENNAQIYNTNLTTIGLHAKNIEQQAGLMKDKKKISLTANKR